MLEPYVLLLRKLDNLESRCLSKLRKQTGNKHIHISESIHKAEGHKHDLTLSQIFRQVNLIYCFNSDQQRLNINLEISLVKDFDFEIIKNLVGNCKYDVEILPRAYGFRVFEGAQTENNYYIYQPGLHKEVIKDFIELGKKTSKPIVEYFLNK